MMAQQFDDTSHMLYPPKWLALLALLGAILLPFLLVKTFPKKYPPLAPVPLSSASLPLLHPTVAHKPARVKTPAVPLAEAVPVKKVAQTAPKVVHPPLLPTTPLSNKAVWHKLTTRGHDSLAALFHRVGLTPTLLQTVMHDVGNIQALKRVRPNETFELLIQHNTLQKMMVPVSTTQYWLIYRVGNHYKTKLCTRPMQVKSILASAEVQGSLYYTAQKKSIPYSLIRQMSSIFTWDIDFSKEVRPKDQFSILYQGYYIDNKLVKMGEILAVSYKTRRKTYEAVRRVDRHGHVEYFTPEGRSLKKAFSRYPLRFSHIGSSFSLSRYHPLLHYYRAHKGIDLAAPIGTPIQATGDGRIEMIGRQNGYGNMIKIRHNGRYSSIYGHLLRFQKGLRKNSWVSRGQIIGYVGQTGLASGPHCHYEFHVNNQPRNPATIELPRGEPIAGRELARFKLNTRPLLAQLHRGAGTTQVARKK